MWKHPCGTQVYRYKFEHISSLQKRLLQHAILATGLDISVLPQTASKQLPAQTVVSLIKDLEN